MSTSSITAQTAFKATSKVTLRLVLAIAIWPLLILIFSQETWWQALLQPLASSGQTVLYERITLLQAAASHATIVLSAMLGVIVIAVPLAIGVTREEGKPFLPIVTNITTVAQTLPPVAVLFLFLPVVGFGIKAIIFALFIYGLMPTIQGTLLGLQSVDQQTIDAAKGIGMSKRESLFKVELPLALPAILSGIRTSLVLIVATAALAPLVGGDSLGTPIIAGFSVNNSTQVLEGALAVALVAIASDFSMRTLEKYFTTWRS